MGRASKSKTSGLPPLIKTFESTPRYEVRRYRVLAPTAEESDDPRASGRVMYLEIELDHGDPSSKIEYIRARVVIGEGAQPIDEQDKIPHDCSTEWSDRLPIYKTDEPFRMADRWNQVYKPSDPQDRKSRRVISGGDQKIREFMAMGWLDEIRDYYLYSLPSLEEYIPDLLLAKRAELDDLQATYKTLMDMAKGMGLEIPESLKEDRSGKSKARTTAKPDGSSESVSK